MYHNMVYNKLNYFPVRDSLRYILFTHIYCCFTSIINVLGRIVDMGIVAVHL